MGEIQKVPAGRCCASRFPSAIWWPSWRALADYAADHQGSEFPGQRRRGRSLGRQICLQYADRGKSAEGSHHRSVPGTKASSTRKVDYGRQARSRPWSRALQRAMDKGSFAFHARPMQEQGLVPGRCSVPKPRASLGQIQQRAGNTRARRAYPFPEIVSTTLRVEAVGEIKFGRRRGSIAWNILPSRRRLTRECPRARSATKYGELARSVLMPAFREGRRRLGPVHARAGRGHGLCPPGVVGADSKQQALRQGGFQAPRSGRLLDLAKPSEVKAVQGPSSPTSRARQTLQLRAQRRSAGSRKKSTPERPPPAARPKSIRFDQARIDGTFDPERFLRLVLGGGSRNG